MQSEDSRIESEIEVKSYIQNIKYILTNGGKIEFQEIRKVDEDRDTKYTNQFTVGDLFPDEDPVDALKREISTLSVEEYIRTVKDNRFPNRSEMREFGRQYNGSDDVYIKLRVEVLGDDGNSFIFIMSFHYAVIPFSDDMFPYKSKDNGQSKIDNEKEKERK